MDIKAAQLAVDSLPIQTIQTPFESVDILRLDLLHPQISGNKFFKLLYPVQDAIAVKAKSIVTLGGAFSNHLHATAYYCHLLKIPCHGIVRGNEVSNPTLDDCKNWGMQLHFTNYEYWANNPEKLQAVLSEKFADSFYIPLGADTQLGTKGFQLLRKQLAPYTHIICSVGTGTTLAGLGLASPASASMIGVQAVVDDTIANKMQQFCKTKKFQLIEEFTFGGFAKYNDDLLIFMKEQLINFNLPLDVVYTAKTWYAIWHGGLQKIIPSSKKNKILFVHTGGMQGNRGVF